MEKRELKAGDVVKIKKNSSPNFGGMLMIVTEPKSFGAQGYINAVISPPNSPHGPVTYGGLAYYRCKFENMEYVGYVSEILELTDEFGPMELREVKVNEIQ